MHSKLQDHRTLDSEEDFLRFLQYVYGRGGHLCYATIFIFFPSSTRGSI